MKKLLGILVLGFLITSCSEYQNVSAPSKYTCGKSEDLIEIIKNDPRVLETINTIFDNYNYEDT